MDRTASHKDPFQNMCLFVCSCCSKKKKAGLFCDELGSYVTLCFYVTSLVSTWKSTINSFNGFFPPQMYATDLNTKMAARGIAVLNIGL